MLQNIYWWCELCYPSPIICYSNKSYTAPSWYLFLIISLTPPRLDSYVRCPHNIFIYSITATFLNSTEMNVTVVMHFHVVNDNR